MLELVSSVKKGNSDVVNVEILSDENNSGSRDEFNKLIKWKNLEAFLVSRKGLLHHLVMKSVQKFSIAKYHKVKSLEKLWLAEKVSKKYDRYVWNFEKC